MRLIDADELAKKAERVAEMWKKSLENPKNEREASDLSKELQLFNAVIAFAKDCPTVDPVKYGRWIEGFPIETTDYFNCSVCYAGIFVNNLWRVSHKDVSEIHRYCHNCGAKMDGDAND